MKNNVNSESPGEPGSNKVTAPRVEMHGAVALGGRVAVRPRLERIDGRGWSRGLGNLLGNELARWWKTRMWLTQSLIWAGTTVFMLYQTPRTWYYEAFDTIPGIFQTIGVIILMQGVLVREKRDGTAAWVMSKPTSRPAFILSKLLAYSFGVLTTMIGASGAVAYAFFSTSPRGVPEPTAFLSVLGVIFLSHMFYLTLSLMLGTFFKSYGPVIGVGAGLLIFSQRLIDDLPGLRYVLPWNLLIGLSGRGESAVYTLLVGQSIEPYLPIIAVVGAECVLFILISLWRFSLEEF